MGGITRTLFGGSTQKSGNKAYKDLSGQLSPNIGLGNQAMTAFASLLGLGDPTSGQSSLNNYLNNTGYQFLRDQGQANIMDGNAARGIMNSGATGKALTAFNQNLASTKLNELFQNFTKLGDYGLGSAGIVSDAGRTSSGSQQGGIFNALFPKGLAGGSS